jgi:hypothetical protein
MVSEYQRLIASLSGRFCFGMPVKAHPLANAALPLHIATLFCSSLQAVVQIQVLAFQLQLHYYLGHIICSYNIIGRAYL